MNEHPFLVFNMNDHDVLCGYMVPGFGVRCNLPASASIHLKYVGMEKPGTPVHPEGERIRCPYGPDGQQVNVLKTKPYWTIEPHAMNDIIAGKTDGRPCPASLMQYPITHEGYEALHTEREAHRDRWRAAVNAEDGMEELPDIDVYSWTDGGLRLRHDRCGEHHGRNDPCPLSPTSQPVKGPHRMGREPHARSSAWALGGRADEDVIPSGEQTTGAIPSTVEGQSVGASAMATVDEVAGTIRAANNSGIDALGVIRQVEDHLAQMRGNVQQVLGQGVSGVLSSYLVQLTQAQENLEQVRRNIAQGQDHGQTFINNLYS